MSGTDRIVFAKFLNAIEARQGASDEKEDSGDRR